MVAAPAAAPPAGSKVPPGPRTVAGPVQKPATSLCLAQPTAWTPAAPSPRKRVGPLAVPAAVRSVTVPVLASLRTARASTVSASRSSSDEAPESLPLGEWPAPGAHMPRSLPRSLTGPPGTFLQAPGTTNGLRSSSAWEPAVESLAPCRAGLREPLAIWTAAPLEGQEGEGLAPCPPLLLAT